jgi:hypothetical protein
MRLDRKNRQYIVCDLIVSVLNVTRSQRWPTFEIVLCTAKTHTLGGRDGACRSEDGRLGVKLSPPGSPGAGINPERSFAAGWSACFIEAMGRVGAP